MCFDYIKDKFDLEYKSILDYMIADIYQIGIFINNNLIALCIYNQYNCNILSIDSLDNSSLKYHIAYVHVDMEHRHKGYNSLFIKELSKNKNAITAYIRSSNKTSLKSFKMNGFKLSHKDKVVYDNGDEKLIMVKI